MGHQDAGAATLLLTALRDQSEVVLIRNRRCLTAPMLAARIESAGRPAGRASAKLLLAAGVDDPTTPSAPMPSRVMSAIEEADDGNGVLVLMDRRRSAQRRNRPRTAAPELERPCGSARHWSGHLWPPWWRPVLA